MAALIISRRREAADLACENQQPGSSERAAVPVTILRCERCLGSAHESPPSGAVDARSRPGPALAGRPSCRRPVRAGIRAGLITLADYDKLRSENCLTRANDVGKRVSQVCLVTSAGAMNAHPFDVRYLLSSWGGEAIYWRHRDQPLGARLRVRGRPAIVTALLDLADPQMLPVSGRWCTPSSPRLWGSRRQVLTSSTARPIHPSRWNRSAIPAT